ncbi:hypothetical protein SCLCIDRAFT_102953, partial [Scleroderma citrinum Foug A]
FANDPHATHWKNNLYYPFASRADWQLVSWLLCSHLSMAAIDKFLSLELVQLGLIQQLPISFQSARELCLHVEMLPSGPHWKSHTLQPWITTKCQVILYYRNPVECIQSLLSHPLFVPHISFIPQKVWTSFAQVVCVYQEWLLGNHAWDLQDQIPNGATLLRVVLSSDKTNILVMSGNQMAHPLLLSLANIDSSVQCKGLLHGRVLLMLLLVTSFIYKKTHICSLLSDCLIHECLDLVLNPLKIAATVGIMMGVPIGNLHYCFTPLVAYIADTPEQSLLAGISPKASPVSTAIYKEFGDLVPHPPRTSSRTLEDIE